MLENTLYRLNITSAVFINASNCFCLPQVRHQAAEVLSHIASDGAEAWTIDHPTRSVVLGRMTAAMDKWDVDKDWCSTSYK